MISCDKHYYSSNNDKCPKCELEKRDHRNDIAKAAMAAIITKIKLIDVPINDNSTIESIAAGVAIGAYAYADAMIKASEDYDD